MPVWTNYTVPKNAGPTRGENVVITGHEIPLRQEIQTGYGKSARPARDRRRPHRERDNNEPLEPLLSRRHQPVGPSSVETGSGVWIVPSSPFLTTKVTSDQNLASADLANIVGLSFSVKAGVYYMFKFLVVWQSTATTESIELGVTTPTFTRYVAGVEIIGGTAGASATWDDVLQTSGDSTTATTANQGPDLDLIAEVRGIIVPSADGVLQVQAASEFAAGNTATVRSGSCGILYTMA